MNLTQSIQTPKLSQSVPMKSRQSAGFIPSAATVSASQVPVAAFGAQHAQARFMGAIHFGAKEKTAPAAAAKKLELPTDKFPNGMTKETMTPSFYKLLERLYAKNQAAGKGSITMHDLILNTLDDEMLRKDAERFFIKTLMVPPPVLRKLFGENPSVNEMTRDAATKNDLFDKSVSDLWGLTYGIKMAQNQAMGSNEPPIVDWKDCLGALFYTGKGQIEHVAIDQLKQITYARKKEGEIVPSTLDQFSKDLGLMFESKKLDPVIGRDKEMLEVMTIVAKRKKRNPILVGEAGTGKTAVVEKLAERLVKRQVPKSLFKDDGKPFQLKEIDMSAIEALGAPDNRKVLKAIIDEAEERNDELILFMDEAHRMNPKDTPGDNLANMWKPALARGAVSLIGATTVDEHRKYIEDDSALNRRFDQVKIEEPSLPETLTILRGIREFFEEVHGVAIMDEALEAAVYKAKRFMPGKFMPDPAIDAIDKAAAQVKNQVGGLSYERLETEGKLYLQEIQLRKGLEKREKEIKEGLDALVAELDVAKDKLKTAYGTKYKDTRLPAASYAEMLDVTVKAQISPFLELPALKPDQQAARKQIECNLKDELAAVVKASKAAGAKQRDYDDTLKDLDKTREKIATLQKELVDKQVLPKVSIQDVLQIISQNSGVPISKLSEDETEKLKKMPEEIRKRVIGQDDAVRAVVAEIQQSKFGIDKGSRPIGSFLFMGPSGVGKTELAKALAEYLFDDEKAMIRVDMSEMMEEHSVSKLIGSPPGYVGYDDGGHLAEKVRKKPYSVVLLDEIDKAHPRVYDLLLQIIDDGRLTDSKGRTVDFKNTIVIMTSNKGTKEIMGQFKQAGGALKPDSRRFKHLYENLKTFAEQAISEGKEAFRPEFRNRIGESVYVFHPLVEDHIRQIVPIQLKSLNKSLAQSDAKVEIKLSDDAIDLLVEKGTDVMMGARPLRNKIDKIKKGITAGLLNGTIAPGTTLTVTAEHLKKWDI